MGPIGGAGDSVALGAGDPRSSAPSPRHGCNKEVRASRLSKKVIVYQYFGIGKAQRPERFVVHPREEREGGCGPPHKEVKVPIRVTCIFLARTRCCKLFLNYLAKGRPRCKYSAGLRTRSTTERPREWQLLAKCLRKDCRVPQTQRHFNRIFTFEQRFITDASE